MPSAPPLDPQASAPRARLPIGAWHALALVLLPLLVIWLYGPAASYGYTNWDDGLLVRDNALLDELSAASLGEVLLPKPREGEALYIPVAYAAWMVEIAVLGKEPQGLHVVNIALHALNAWLVYLLLLQIVLRPAFALLGAAVFAGHPLQVESVAWIMGQRDLLAGAFCLLSVLAHLRLQDTRKERWYVLSVLLFALGLFTKPVVAVTPLLLLLLEAWRGRSMRACAWVAKIPYAALVVLAVVLSGLTAHEGLGDAPGLGLRLLCVPWLAWHWLRQIVALGMPVPFHAWPSSEAPLHVALLGGAATLFVLGVLVFAWRRRLLALGLLLLGLLAALAPAAWAVLQGSRSFITADRYGYLPLVVVAALAAAGLRAARGQARALLAAALVAWLAASVLVTRQSVPVWTDSVSVWTRVLDVHPDLREARINRGVAHAEARDFEAAWRDFEHALERTPTHPVLLRNAARMMFDWGRPEHTIELLERYLEHHEEDVEIYVALGVAGRQTGRLADALQWYRRAQRLAPKDPRPRAGLARVLLDHQLQRIAQNPQDAEALLQAGRALESLGEWQRAVELFTRLSSFASPLQAEGYVGVGRIFLARGMREGAVAALESALRLEPRHAEALQLLGR